MSIHSTTPPDRRMGCLVKGLAALGIVVFALIGGCLYFESRRPPFSGTSASAIDVHIGGFDHTDYRISITNRHACQTVLREFSQARPYYSLKKAFGEMTFYYDSGKTNLVWILPGKGHYTILFDEGKAMFQMPNERFLSVLKEVGVDVSKISQY